MSTVSKNDRLSLSTIALYVATRLKKLIKVINMLLYHVTSHRNIKSIKIHGLIPQLGPNAKSCGETKPAIWCFPNKQSMNDALGGWFEDLCDDEHGMDCIVIDVPNHYVKNSTVKYEKTITQSVNPKYIKKIFNIW